MMSSNIKRTRAQSLVYNCCLVFSEEALERLSPYAEQVASDANKEKISIISGLDPFLGPLGACTETVPSVEASDYLVSYLVLQTRFLTAKQLFKAHKSMEAYDQFVCGCMGEESQNMEKGEENI